MRKIWLQKPDTLEIWDLLPADSMDRDNACPFLNIKGMGYKQEVTQNQVNAEYAVSNVLTKNQPITGIMYFQDDEHIKAFQGFVGDFREQLILYYSPSGEYEPYDVISAPFYKKVIISQVDKTEMDEYGWYALSTTISTQDDVWNRNVRFDVRELSTESPYIVNIGDSTGITSASIDAGVYTEKFGSYDNIQSTETFSYNGTNWIYNGTAIVLSEYGLTVEGTAVNGDILTVQKSGMVGEALVYPYTYPYSIGGRMVLKVEFNNTGREVGSIIKIKNNGQTNLENVEWFIDREKVDNYGIVTEYADVQRAKWLLNLSPNSELYVDSNPLTQEAKVSYDDGTSQSVVDLQEPSWEYINFVNIPHGKNRIVFYVDNVENGSIDISFMYREQKEVI